MSKSGLRKIKIAEETFHWKVGHYHLEEFHYSECVDRITIYLDGYKNTPLILHFRLEDNRLLSQQKEWFMDSGCLLNGKKVINLNRPAVIAYLIKYYTSHHWKPKSPKGRLEVIDALKLLELTDFPEGAK